MHKFNISFGKAPASKSLCIKLLNVGSNGEPLFIM